MTVINQTTDSQTHLWYVDSFFKISFIKDATVSKMLEEFNVVVVYKMFLLIFKMKLFLIVIT